MRLFIIPMLFFLAISTYGPKSKVTGQITKTDPAIDFKYLTVLLYQSNKVVNGAVPDSNGFFSIPIVPYGIYSLIIKQSGYRDLIKDFVNVSDNNTVNLNLSYPSLCPFKFDQGEKPVCETGHKDRIIPIVYGEPTNRTMRRAGKGLVRLGGCIVSDCDPKYYCKVHKKEL